MAQITQVLRHGVVNRVGVLDLIRPMVLLLKKMANFGDSTMVLP